MTSFHLLFLMVMTTGLAFFSMNLHSVSGGFSSLVYASAGILFASGGFICLEVLLYRLFQLMM